MEPSSPLRAPRWIVAHVLIGALTITFVLLGQWQLRRMAQERTDQQALEARLDAPPTPLTEVVPDGVDASAVHDVEFTRVAVTGRFAPADEVLLRSRTNQGRNGYHVLTPLELGDGRGVLVDRGWVPFELDDPPVAEAAPPAGTVTVVGLVRSSQPGAGFGPRDPVEGPLERAFHADVARLDRQIDLDLLPVIVQLRGQTPAQSGRLPVPADPPAFDPSQNLSYAVQWFSFAAIAVVGYGVGLRRLVRDDRRRSGAVEPLVRA